MRSNMYKFEILQSMAKKYNQASNDSLLWKDIMLVLDCTEKQAKKYALSHCNSVSFWMGLFITDKICINYDEYFKIGYESGYIKENGYITDKPALCEKLGVKNFELNFIEDYRKIINPINLKDNGVYQLRLYTGRTLTGKRKNHFIICMMKMGALFLFDTMDRGVGVLAFKAIKEKQFEKLLDMN